jgi:hypothetical protein
MLAVVEIACPEGQVQRVLEPDWSPRTAAEAAGCSTRAVDRWLARYRVEGEGGRVDRSTTPHEAPAARFAAFRNQAVPGSGTKKR